MIAELALIGTILSNECNMLHVLNGIGVTLRTLQQSFGLEVLHSLFKSTAKVSQM